MIRTQVQLTEDQHRALKARSRQLKVSMAELVRESVELYLLESGVRTPVEKRRRALAVVGRFRSGLRDLAADHDRYLEETFSE